MNKIPFSIYDFFGYLSCGFLLLAAVDFAFNGSALLTKKLDGLSGSVLFFILIVFVIGHLLASIASSLLESGMLKRVLGPSEEVIFAEHRRRGGWARLFPGYYGTLPKETRARVLAKAQERVGITAPGRGLFLHCHALVKREQVTLERLNIFLNAYGFCRNLSVTALLSSLVVLWPAIDAAWRGAPLPHANLQWAGLGLTTSIGMFYRYLKFYRLYTVEVFVSYAETDANNP